MRAPARSRRLPPDRTPTFNVRVSPDALTRFAAIGDLHAEHARLAAILTWLSGQAVRHVLSVGDIVDGAGDVDRCCELLRAHAAIAVRGNHERWMLAGSLRDLRDAHRREALAPASLDFLAGLPATRSLPTVRGELLLCHGVDTDDMARLRPHDEGYALESNTALQALLAAPGPRWLVGGHTHKRMVRTFARRTGPPLVVINPGTLHRDYPASFAIVDLERGRVEFHEAFAGADDEVLLHPAEVIALPT
jgi:predicted phosphodiesterase